MKPKCPATLFLYVVLISCILGYLGICELLKAV